MSELGEQSIAHFINLNGANQSKVIQSYIAKCDSLLKEIKFITSIAEQFKVPISSHQSYDLFKNALT